MSRNKKEEGNYEAPFPKALRMLLEERGQTQGDIAKVTGKTRQTVSQYCNGISEPSYETLVKIADHFDVSLDYLLGRTADPARNPCAADELGLSAGAVEKIHLYHEYDKRQCLDGLSVLIEDGGLLGLTEAIDRFIQKVDDSIRISHAYQETTPIEGDTSDDYFMWRRAAEEDLLALEFQRLIEANYPNFKGQFQIVVGSHMVEDEKRRITDTFEVILRRVSNYDKFRDNVIRWGEVLYGKHKKD